MMEIEASQGLAKRIFVALLHTQPCGGVSVDTVMERVENKYWKIEVNDFKSWMLGFAKFTVECKPTELEPSKILIEDTYTLHANTPIYPFNWLFARIFWIVYVQLVLEDIRTMAYNKEP